MAKSAGFTLRNEGGAGMVAGSWRAAEAIAEFTSCAAASMSRSSANWMVMRVVPWPLTEVISSMPAMVENCFSSTVATDAAMVSGLAPDKLALLRHGLSLDDEPLRPAQVEWLNDDQLRFVLTEGKKRQIRRMCEAVGLQVLGLKRVRIGGVALGNLPTGQWRYLAPGERF